MMKGNNFEIKRGHIYMCDLGKGVGSEQSGIRPVLVTKNQKGIDNSPVITIIPMTSKINKGKKLQTHITIGKECGLLVDSDLQIEQFTTKDKESFLFYNANKNNYEIREMGKVSDSVLNRVDIALRRDNGFISYYFNENHAFHLLDMFCSVLHLPNTDEIKNYFKTEFKNYCSTYNMDYKTIVGRYNANKKIPVSHDCYTIVSDAHCYS